jgi:hypothetical protein
MATYLSLDLDFFNAAGKQVEPVFFGLVEKHLKQVGEFVKRTGTPCVAVMNHQQMLPFVDESGCDTLLNVDTHSDLADTGVNEFSCGTWVSYVKWRATGKYVWQHGYSAYHGDCSSFSNLYRPRPGRQRGEMSGWRFATHVQNRQMPRLTSAIKSIGVCLSPSYVDFSEETGEIMRNWAKKYGIRYVKGRLDENFSVPRIPR